MARKVSDKFIIGAPLGCAFEVPILPDRYGNTALDYVLGIRETIQYNKIFVSINESAEDLLKSENFAMAEAIFRGITDYGFMHSSFYVKDAVIEATKIGLDGVG